MDSEQYNEIMARLLDIAYEVEGVKKMVNVAMLTVFNNENLIKRFAAFFEMYEPFLVEKTFDLPPEKRMSNEKYIKYSLETLGITREMDKKTLHDQNEFLKYHGLEGNLKDYPGDINLKELAERAIKENVDLSIKYDDPTDGAAGDGK